MASIPRTSTNRQVNYPTSDGKPMAETDVHRDLMMDLIQTLETYYAADPMVYVSGNLLLFYEEGNRRKHVSPDVFVVRGVAKHQRENYLAWSEGKGPDLAIELTSRSTRSEDVKTKMALYRDVLQVAEYFLFDPNEDYLKPSMQGYRLVEGQYQPIEPVEGRLPSVVLGLHLERSEAYLRLFEPATARWLPTDDERAEAERQRADAAKELANVAQELANAAQERADRELANRLEAEAETARLRLELEALRRLRDGGG